MNDIIFSIIIFNDNHSNLIKVLNSIKNQNYDLNKVEIIIETLELEDEILNKLNDLNLNIIIRKHEEASIDTCYNDALSTCKGEYITFINSNILYENKKTFQNIQNIKNSRIIVTNMEYFDQDMESKKKYALSSKVEQYVDIEKTSGKINTCLESYFIKRKLIGNLLFDKNFENECKEKFIVDLYEKEKEYYNLGTTTLVSLVPFDDNTSKCSIQYDNNWYNKSLTNWINYVEKMKYVPMYLQEMLMYIIYAKYNCNTNDRNKNVLNDEELELFVNNTKELLKYINNNIILQEKIDGELKKIGHRFKIPYSLKKNYYHF